MTTHSSSELLVAWLRDAHAMEKGIVTALENHAKGAAAFPTLRARLDQHVMESREHVNLVEQCLRQLGEEPSSIKNTVSRFLGAVQSAAASAFQDDVVKNSLQDYGTEHFEVACYRALIEAATALNRPEMVQIFRRILREEEAMAQFLEQQLPTVVHETLGVTV
jgi:ferritin-like metal-binding protein YciE